MISSHGYQNLLLQTEITTSTIGGRHRNDAALFTTVMSEMCVYMLLALTVTLRSISCLEIRFCYCLYME